MKYVKIAALSLVLGANLASAMSLIESLPKNSQQQLKGKEGIQLIQAVLGRDDKKVQSLLEGGVDPNIVPTKESFSNSGLGFYAGRTPLYLAFYKIEEFDELLDGSPSLANNNAMMKFYSPEKSLKIAELLLEYGADPEKSINGSKSFDRNAFDIARRNGTVHDLLAEYYSKNFQMFSAEAIAKAINEGTMILEEVKESYPPEIMPKSFYEKLDLSPESKASLTSPMNLTKSYYDLLKKRLNGSKKEFSRINTLSLELAIKEESMDVNKVREALENSADPNTTISNGTLLTSVIAREDFDSNQKAQEIAELLLQYGANPYIKRKEIFLDKNKNKAKNTFEVIAEEEKMGHKKERARELLAKYNQPKTLQLLSVEGVARAIKEGTITLEKIKENYPPEIMPESFYEKLDLLIQKNE